MPGGFDPETPPSMRNVVPTIDDLDVIDWDDEPAVCVFCGTPGGPDHPLLIKGAAVPAGVVPSYYSFCVTCPRPPTPGPWRRGGLPLDAVPHAIAFPPWPSRLPNPRHAPSCRPGCPFLDDLRAAFPRYMKAAAGRMPRRWSDVQRVSGYRPSNFYSGLQRHSIAVKTTLPAAVFDALRA
jgi:hypothetical protein